MILSVKRKLLKRLVCFIAILLVLVYKSYALDKKASDTLSHYIMAVMYDDLGHVEKAVKEYKEALRTDYENTVIHLNLAVTYIKSNQLEKAVEELSIAIKLDPESVEPHAILALLFSLQNKTEESNREYEISLKNASRINPKNIDIYRNLGELYLGQKKIKAAENMYKMVLELAPNDPQAHFYLANILDLAGNKKGAEQELKKAIKNNPDYHEALNYLGYFYVEENKNLDSAQDLINKAIGISPNNGAYIDSLGWLYFKKAKFKESKKLLIEAASLIKDPVIYDHLGDVYFKLGETENAVNSWQESLKLNLEQPKVKEKIDKLDKPVKK